MLESVIDGEMLPPLSLLLLQKMAANAVITRITLGVTDGAFTADLEEEIAASDNVPGQETEDAAL
jgi:type VI secretion system protein VasG